MLSAKQKKCIELMALGTLSQKEVARDIKITEQTLCNWKKNEEFISELETRIRTSIRSLAAKALRTQISLLSAKSEMVRYMVSKDILDRAGYEHDKNINISGNEAVTIINDIPRSDSGAETD